MQHTNDIDDCVDDIVDDCVDDIVDVSTLATFSNTVMLYRPSLYQPLA